MQLTVADGQPKASERKVPWPRDLLEPEDTDLERPRRVGVRDDQGGMVESDALVRRPCMA